MLASGKSRKLAKLFEEEEYIVIEAEIPQQLREGLEEMTSLTSTAKAVTMVLTVGFAFTFILNLVLKSVMSQLWSIFNTLQIILALPLLNVLMPANVVFVQNIVYEIINFQIIDKKTLQKKFIEPIFGVPVTDNCLDYNNNSVTSRFKS